MRDLIRKILLEYTYTPEIEIIVLDSILSESELKLITESEATVNVPTNIKSEVENYLNVINKTNQGFYAKAINSNTNTEVKKKFFIEPTKHYLQRLFRTKEPDYKPGGDNYNPNIVDPETFEGIDLVYDAKDKLLRYHFSNQPKSHILGKNILIRTYVNKKPMSVILKVIENVFLKKSYTLVLKTQIKGIDFKSPKVDIKLDYP